MGYRYSMGSRGSVLLLIPACNQIGLSVVDQHYFLATSGTRGVSLSNASLLSESGSV